MKKASRYFRQNAYIPRVILVGYLIYLSTGLFYRKTFTPFASVDHFFNDIGQAIFSFFGLMISTLSGSIIQILIPVVLVCFFALKRRDYFAAGIMLWWVGENLTNISIYMANANTRELPLVTGNHDWFILLNMWGALDQTTLLSNLTWQAGIMLILTGIMWSLMYSHRSIKGGMLRTIPGKQKLKVKIKKQAAVKHDPSCSKHWEEVANE